MGLRIQVWNKVGSGWGDFYVHFYEMKIHSESKTFPAMGAKLLGATELKDTTTPKIPGSAFYLYYMLCYKLGGMSLDNAIIVNFIFSILAACIFLFWIYKRFGLIILSVISSLVLMNGFYTYTNFIFYNPNLTLILSFLFLPVLAEYISKEKSHIEALLIFPLLAIMAQTHIAVFHGLIPTVLIYMIIRYKHTIKNIIPLIISVILAFFTYLPYLIYELRNNFPNLKNVIETASNSARSSSIGAYIPRFQALVMFPTNEMSDQYSGNFMFLWNKDNPFTFFSFPIMILSICIMATILVLIIIKYVKKKAFLYNSCKDDNNIFLLKELMTVYFLYFPVSTLATFFLYGVSGPFRYHFSIFTLSFTPWILFLYFIIKNKKNKLVFSILLFTMISTISMYATNYMYYTKYEEPESWKSHRDAVISIGEDANGEEFSLTKDSYEYSFLNNSGIAYNKTGMWNIITNTNANIIYNIEYKNYNKLDTEKYLNAKLIESNNIFIIHRIN